MYNGALLDQMGVTGKKDDDSSRSNSPPQSHHLNMDDTPGSTNVMIGQKTPGLSLSKGIPQMKRQDSENVLTKKPSLKDEEEKKV